MSQSLTRRQVAKGAAWAAPAVVATAAVPAYAASPKPAMNEIYFLEGSWQSEHHLSGSTLTVEVSNSQGVSGQIPGFGISYVDGQATDTTATISSVEFFYAFPKGALDPSSFQVVSGNWTYEGVTGQSTIETSNGTNPDGSYAGTTSHDASNLDVFRFVWTGATSGPVAADSADLPWNGSDTLVADANGTVYDSSFYNTKGVYGGYIATYTIPGVGTQTSNAISAGNSIYA